MELYLCHSPKRASTWERGSGASLKTQELTRAKAMQTKSVNISIPSDPNKIIIFGY